MLRVVLKNKQIIPTRKISKFFSTATANLYPDQIVKQVKSSLEHEVSESQWAEVEANIMDNIHFFDADQYVDTVCLLGFANKGTEALWDLLSRKIYDYEIDLPQTYVLDEALSRTNKHQSFLADPIARNNLVYDLKWPNESKLFKYLL